jgi:hypothetical protein
MVVGRTVSSGRPKKEGRGRGWEVVKRVTCRRTYFWCLTASVLLR